MHAGPAIPGRSAIAAPPFAHEVVVQNPSESLPLSSLVTQAQRGLTTYLSDAFQRGELSENYFNQAISCAVPSIAEWLTSPEIDRLSPQLKAGLADAIMAEHWPILSNAFSKEVAFGTGGIRALMALERREILELKKVGLQARIVKGPNTINDIVVMRCAQAVASHYVNARPGVAPRAVVGYDSRVQGAAFAELIASVFLSVGVEVFLFDEPVPYPEVTFTIPFRGLDFGVFISASHNDYRYNGFKISSANGSQIAPDVRESVMRRLADPKLLASIHPVDLRTAPPAVLDRLHFLGGDRPLPREYFGRERSLEDIHAQLIRQLKQFIVDPQVLEGPAANLVLAYAAFNGAGRRIVPKVLGELGFSRVYRIAALDALDGMFPAFKNTPGEEQQPDPGDPRSADIALALLEQEARDPKLTPPAPPWKTADILIGTDPDADRCGAVVHTPASLAPLFQGMPSLRYRAARMLLPADDVWTLLLRYRLTHRAAGAAERDPRTSFIALSHTTSDALTALATKYGLGVLKTWVGFGLLSSGVAEVWTGRPLPGLREGRVPGAPADTKCHRVFYDTTGIAAGQVWNAACLEQSNGFSILGGPTAAAASRMGEGGHVRDKDGTLAAVLVAELAAYAKSTGEDLASLLAKWVFEDPDIGVYANYYEPDPLDGEYPGLVGSSKKKRILDKSLAIAARVNQGGMKIGPRQATRSSIYWTGKYDKENGMVGFPDEGIRLWFGSDLDYATIRPSGTTNSLRFHVQLHGGSHPGSTAWEHRIRLEKEAREIVDAIRDLVEAPRQSGVEF